VLGEAVTDLRGTALRRFRTRVGFVFQRHNLVARLSALTNVVHGANRASRAHAPGFKGSPPPRYGARPLHASPASGWQIAPCSGPTRSLADNPSASRSRAC
jgi:hypothetical protein